MWLGKGITFSGTAQYIPPPFFFSHSLDSVDLLGPYSQKAWTEACSSHIPRIWYSQAEYNSRHAQGFPTSDTEGLQYLEQEARTK